MAQYPAVTVKPNAVVTLRLTFTGVAHYRIYICQLSDNDWTVESQIEDNGDSEDATPNVYSISALQAGDTRLVFIPMNLSSPSGGDVRCTAAFLQNGNSVGEASTPPASSTSGWVSAGLRVQLVTS